MLASVEKPGLPASVWIQRTVSLVSRFSPVGIDSWQFSMLFVLAFVS